MVKRNRILLSGKVVQPKRSPSTCKLKKCWYGCSINTMRHNNLWSCPRFEELWASHRTKYRPRAMEGARKKTCPSGLFLSLSNAHCAATNVFPAPAGADKWTSPCFRRSLISLTFSFWWSVKSERFSSSRSKTLQKCVLSTCTCHFFKDSFMRDSKSLFKTTFRTCWRDAMLSIPSLRASEGVPSGNTKSWFVTIPRSVDNESFTRSTKFSRPTSASIAWIKSACLTRSVTKMCHFVWDSTVHFASSGFSGILKGTSSKVPLHHCLPSHASTLAPTLNSSFRKWLTSTWS